jgi:hypothetical protein
MGVFATRDIPAYSYLTMYPCDGVAIQPWDLRHTDIEICLGWEFGSAATKVAYSQLLTPPPRTSNLAIIGNPELKDDAHFLAHLINDSVVCKRAEAGMIYNATSMMKMNSVYDPVFRAQFSTKDIKAGEEVLTSYGAEYWLDLKKYTV